MRKELNSYRVVLVHQHGRGFNVLGRQYGRHDVMWIRFLGSLSNDDEGASENVAKKMNLHSFKLYRVFLDLLSWSMWAIFPGFQFLRTVAEFKNKTRNYSP